MPSSQVETTTSLNGRKKVALGVAGAVAAAGLFAGGLWTSGAVFTSDAEVGGQSVRTATVEIDATTAGSSAPIAVTDMLPGDTQSTEITVRNTGTAEVYWSLKLPVGIGSNTDLNDALDVTVTVGSTTVTHPLSTWQTGRVEVGSLAAGASATVTVSAELPEAADNALQGTQTSFSVYAEAIQARNTTAPTVGWTLTN